MEVGEMCLSFKKICDALILWLDFINMSYDISDISGVMKFAWDMMLL